MGQFDCAVQTQFLLKFCNVDSESACGSMNNSISITPKLTSLLSILGSALIIFRYFKTPQKMRRTYDRLVLPMAVMHIFGCVGYFIGQWSYPYVEGGRPNTSSFCNFQGWLIQINSAVWIYNTLIATLFILRVYFGWHEDKLKRYEYLLHGIALLYPTITSFIALGMGMYGKAGPWCWIDVRYDWARWTFFFVPLWICMIFSACCMVFIVFVVKKSETMTTTTFRVDTKSKVGKGTKQIMRQVILYIGVFLLTWGFGTANRIQNTVSVATGVKCSLFPIMWLTTFFVPLQGFGSFMVYLYPRIVESKKQRKWQARERAQANQTLTRKQALIDLGRSIYEVLFEVGSILPPSTTRKSRSNGRDSLQIPSTATSTASPPSRTETLAARSAAKTEFRESGLVLSVDPILATSNDPPTPSPSMLISLDHDELLS